MDSQPAKPAITEHMESENVQRGKPAVAEQMDFAKRVKPAMNTTSSEHVKSAKTKHHKSIHSAHEKSEGSHSKHAKPEVSSQAHGRQYRGYYVQEEVIFPMHLQSLEVSSSGFGNGQVLKVSGNGSDWLGNFELRGWSWSLPEDLALRVVKVMKTYHDDDGDRYGEIIMYEGTCDREMDRFEGEWRVLESDAKGPFSFVAARSGQTLSSSSSAAAFSQGSSGCGKGWRGRAFRQCWSRVLVHAAFATAIIMSCVAAVMTVIAVKRLLHEQCNNKSKSSGCCRHRLKKEEESQTSPSLLGEDRFFGDIMMTTVHHPGEQQLSDGNTRRVVPILTNAPL